MECKLKTNTFDGGLIEQILTFEDSTRNIKDEILRQIMETKEEATKKALIDLGWTPPKPMEANGLPKSPLDTIGEDVGNNKIIEDCALIAEKMSTWHGVKGTVYEDLPRNIAAEIRRIKSL